MTEKIARSDEKTVLVGMTGSIDSTIAAYLLLKQEYKCIGLTIILDKVDAKGFKEQDSLYGSCLVQNPEKVKKICQDLGMPFYAVNARDIYKANVLDFEVSSRIQGKTFRHCVACNRLKLDVLIEKADLLGVQHIATGHYSKIKFNRDTGEYSLHASSDLNDDQSYLLSTIEKHHLQRLILPLGDMRKKEVLKLGKTLRYDYHSASQKTYCFFNNNKVIEYVEQNTPASLHWKGDIVTSSNKEVLGEHTGIHKYYVGQDKFTVQDETFLKHYLVSDINPSNKRVIVAKASEAIFNYCHLVGFESVNCLDTTRPFTAFAQWSKKGVRASCLVRFKANKMVTLLFDKVEQGPLPLGAVVVLYNRNTPTAKVIGSGKALECGMFELLVRMQGMLNDDARVTFEEDRKNRNIDESHY